MKQVLIRASTRGHIDHGWLDTHHTFSFADYYDPTRIHFGALRVINDDIVIGGEGFGTHPHDNMEIISIPLYGELEHKDSMGFSGVIRPGEVQVMSAGTGITHSEFNANKERPLNFFQIWIFPNQRDVEPRYEQREFDFIHSKNYFQQIVSPDPDDEGLWIHQDAWLSIGTFDNEFETEYRIKRQGNGVYVMVVDGEFIVEDQALYHRDGLGIWETDTIKIKSASDNARLMIIDVPMSV